MTKSTVYKPTNKELIPSEQLQPEKFPTLFEALVKNSSYRRVSTSRASAGTIYTVPDGFSFLLLGCTLSMSNTAAGNAQANMYTDLGGDILHLIGASGGAVSSSLSFSIPFIFLQAEKIYLNLSGASNDVYATIIGYEISNSQSSKLLFS